MNPNRFLLHRSPKTWSKLLGLAVALSFALSVAGQQQSKPLPITDRLFTGYQSYFATSVDFNPTQQIAGATVTVTGVKSQFVYGPASSITLYWNDTLIATAAIPNSDTAVVRIKIPPKYLHKSRNVLGLEISLTEGGNPCTTLYKKDLWFKGLPNANISWETAVKLEQDVLSAFGQVKRIILHPEASSSTKLLASAIASKVGAWTGNRVSFRYDADTVPAVYVGLAKHIPPSMAIGVYDVPPMQTARLSLVRHSDSTAHNGGGLLLTAVSEKGIERALKQVLQLEPEDLAGKQEFILGTKNTVSEYAAEPAHLPVNRFAFCEATRTGWAEVRQYYRFSRAQLPGAYEAFLLGLQSQLIDLPTNAKLLYTLKLNGKVRASKALKTSDALEVTDSLPARVLQHENQLEVVYKLAGEMPPCTDVGRYLTLNTQTQESGLYGLGDKVAALQWPLPNSLKNKGTVHLSNNLELAACDLATQILHKATPWQELEVATEDSIQAATVCIVSPADLDAMTPLSDHITWGAKSVHIATGEKDTTVIDLEESDAAVFLDGTADRQRTVFVIKDIISVNALRPYFAAMPNTSFYMAYWNKAGKSYWQHHVAPEPIRWKLTWYWHRYKLHIVLGITVALVLAVVVNFVRARANRKNRPGKA